MKLSGIITAVVVGTLLTSSAHAGIITIAGVGDVDSNNGLVGAMEGSTFTFEIVIQEAGSDGSGGTPFSIAIFNDSITSFTVDGLSLIGPGTDQAEVLYSRQPGNFDIVDLDASDFEGIQASAGGPLTLDYFGPGPYNTNQLLDLELSDFLYSFSFNLYDSPTAKSAHGTVTSFVVTPEPATLSLLALGGLLVIRRRRVS